MNANSKLARLRVEVDIIDNQLLELIEQRLLLCSAIGKAKERATPLLLRPRRQKSLVDRLKSRATIAPPDAIEHIWRELMAHSLRLQACCPFLIVDAGERERTLRLVRERFGSAAPVEWTNSAEEALARAVKEQLVAIVPHGSNAPLPSGLISFGQLCDDAGYPVASAIGRIDEAEFDISRSGAGVQIEWAPASWRRRSALQLPAYDDIVKLKEVERRLAQRASIVELNDVDELSKGLANVAQGGAILLQGGDCAETFDGMTRGRTRAVADLLAEIAAIIEGKSAKNVICVGRLAGQLAKPRTRITEVVHGIEVPAYRGDAINGIGLAHRAPDSERLLSAQEHSELVARWLADYIPASSKPVYTSHEALLLNYEEALTRLDELSGRWWSGSAHLLWIGDRTRQVDGAHVEYARGIANPIAVKCGPTLDPGELLRLLDVLNPERAPARVALIPRLGHKLVGSRLPALMRAVLREGWTLPWVVDPMHGNTQVVGSLKTRDLAHIRAEISAFFCVALSEGVWPGGVHLELTPADVTECIDGKSVTELTLPLRYRSACDPRLNRDQALEIAQLIADQYSAFRGSWGRR
jgi:3-deoxy-7-phosphoheptulonate synthase